MEGVHQFGLPLEVEFRGDFDNASVKKNVRLVSQPNTPQLAIVSDGLGEIGWHFSSEGGERGIYVSYASEQEVACELLVNGELVQSFALSEGQPWILRETDWRFQVTTRLRPGANEVVLRGLDKCHRLASVVVGSPPPPGNVSIDEYTLRIAERRRDCDAISSFVMAPSDLRGLIREIRVIGRQGPGCLDSFRSIVRLIVDAVVEDGENGQSRLGFGGPLNGQRYRQRLFDRLLQLGVDSILETGAFLGTSTEFFSRRGLPVFSCEVSDQYFARAVVHTASADNVKLYFGDSRAFLRRCANRIDANGIQFPFVYLDAHWDADLPLAEEIDIIVSNWANYVIMVDDFKVPGTSYSYDRYGKGVELSLEYLYSRGVNLEHVAVLFPSVSPYTETGKRRGTLVLVPEEVFERDLSWERLFYRHLGVRPELDNG